MLRAKCLPKGHFYASLALLIFDEVESKKRETKRERENEDREEVGNMQSKMSFYFCVK